MRTGRRARFLVVLLAILGIIGLSGPARAQYTGTITPSDTTLNMGQSSTVTVHNVEANEGYTLSLFQNPTAVLDTATTNNAGSATFGFTIPLTGFSAGAAQLIASPSDRTGAQARIDVTLLAAQASPSPSPTATAAVARLVPNKNSYRAGEAGTAAGSGLTVSESYHLDFIQSPGINLDVRSTNVAGAITFAFRIPSGARNGGATLRAHPVDNSGIVATASITISGAATGAQLPKTGRNILTYIGLGILLVIVGWMMVMYYRHRRRAAAEARHPMSQPSESTKV